ncbi:hypothetical protein CAEBREN_15052 [Caenorhabditis brenneri]|uniref:Uncharacterized protein n=1 Tax=Caenorhabditis brenneri TaxID=135651 RepID=G0MAU4_CAEBE|nr:hypothetical protein CAEBREN_15052 [Caenorhabditis brenneri]
MDLRTLSWLGTMGYFQTSEPDGMDSRRIEHQSH